MAKEIINGIDTFEKGVNEIQRLGSVVSDFNETVETISEALITVSDQEHIIELYEASQIAKEELNSLKDTIKNINDEYDELINLKLYKDNLLQEINELKDEIKLMKKDIKDMKSENKQLLKSFKDEIISVIKESTSNISVQTQIKEEDISYYSELANKYLVNKEYKEAINCYSKIINLKISRDELCEKDDYINRAKLYELTGQIESAMSDYKKASELN